MKDRIKKFEAPAALVYCAVILCLMEYFFIPPRAEAWLHGQGLFGWGVPSLQAGLIWAASCLLGFFFIPVILTRAFGNALADYGFSIKGFLRSLPIYLLLYLLVIPLIYFASLQQHFAEVYPFVPSAKSSLENFLTWEVAYVLQFFALEFFFRGYLLYTLHKYVDKWLAIAIMLVPYVMIHFHKPFLETMAAIFAGGVLGYLSLKNRTWLGGAVLHALVAVSMDTLAIFHSGISW